MLTALLVLLAFTADASGTLLPQAPPPPSPQPVAPAATDVDPARLVFPVDAAGAVLVAVKPDKTADYEAVIHALHQALADAEPAARRIGEGWRVYRATDADAKGNALYIHLIATPVAEADYRPSVVLAGLVRDLPVDLLVKYRDAFAGATRLSLHLVSDFSLTPVARPKP